MSKTMSLFGLLRGQVGWFNIVVLSLFQSYGNVIIAGKILRDQPTPSVTRAGLKVLNCSLIEKTNTFSRHYNQIAPF